MHTRQLVQTGLSVSPIGLGLAALGRPGYINLGHADDLRHNYDLAVMEAHCHQVLDAAWQAGVRYFDAARSYGRAEAFLGRWLTSRNIAPDAVTVGSKWGYTYTADWQIQADKHEVKEHTLPVLRRQSQETLDLLGNYLNLYQIHSATLDSGVLDNQEVLQELRSLKAQHGLKIGLSLSGPGQAATLERAMTITATDGEFLFDCVQATWNILEQSAGAALQAAHARGMGVIIKEALANGRLTARNDSPDFAETKARLTATAEQYGVAIDAVALAAVLSQPWVDVVLSGAAKREHLDANLAAVEIAGDDGRFAHLASLQEPPEEYWQKRSQLAWN